MRARAIGPLALAVFAALALAPMGRTKGLPPAAARALVAEREAAHGPEAVETAEALDLLVESLREEEEGGAAEALAAAARAVSIKEAALAPADPALGRSLAALGRVRMGRDRKGARQALERALVILEPAGAAEEMTLASVLNNLAQLDGATPRGHARARERLERVLGILAANRPPDDPLVAKTCANYGHLLREMTLYREAGEQYARALRIFEAGSGPESHEVASILNNIGNLRLEVGDLPGALEASARSLAIRERASTTDPADLARSLSNHAGVLRRCGELETARTHYERALALREAAPPSRRASTLDGYATVLAELGEVDRAREAYLEALALLEEALRPDDFRVGLVLVGLARVEARGEPALARERLERALRIEEAAPVAHPRLAAVLAALAALDLEAGDVPAARARYRRAIDLVTERLGADHPSLAEMLLGSSRAELRAGSDAEALAFARRAAAVVDQHVRITSSVLPERLALRLAERSVHPEEVLLAGLLAGREPRQEWLAACWEWTLRRRGAVLDELAARHRAAHSALGTGDETRRAWERLAGARRRLAALWTSGPEGSGAGEDAALGSARREKEEAEAELARASARFRREHAARRASLAELARALPRDAILAEIVRGPERDVALILHPDGRTAFADLGPSRELDARAHAWREALREAARHLAGGPGPTARRQMLDAGAALRAVAWDPVVGGAGSAVAVYLVPDGALHLVDPGALPAREGGFVAERGPTVHVLDAARDLLEMEDPAGPEGTGALVVGAPAFGTGAPVSHLDPCSGAARPPWPALHESQTEARRIGTILAAGREVTLLLGREATEERFRREAPGRQVLHVATHAFFLQGECGSGARRRSVPSPLLLSGLVFAGANGAVAAGREDGLLTAEELASLDLSGVRLAVLSACDTARGEIGIGEGVFGLRRAARLAGVRSLVTTVWPVPDARARKWAAAFHREWAAGRPTHEAARRAGLALLDQARASGRFPHPYLWSGFVTSGDWRGAPRSNQLARNRSAEGPPPTPSR